MGGLQKFKRYYKSHEALDLPLIGDMIRQASLVGMTQEQLTSISSRRLNRSSGSQQKKLETESEELMRMIQDWGQIARPSGKPAVNQPTFSFKATKLLRELYDVVTDTVTTGDRSDRLRLECIWVPENEEGDVYEDGLPVESEIRQEPPHRASLPIEEDDEDEEDGEYTTVSLSSHVANASAVVQPSQVGSEQGNGGNVGVEDKDLEYELGNQGDNEALVSSVVKAYGTFNDDEETMEIKGEPEIGMDGLGLLFSNGNTLGMGNEGRDKEVEDNEAMNDKGEEAVNGEGQEAVNGEGQEAVNGEGQEAVNAEANDEYIEWCKTLLIGI